MAMKRYKIQDKQPLTDRDKRVVRDKQLVDRADKLFLKHAKLLLLAALLTRALGGGIQALLDFLRSVALAAASGSAISWLAGLFTVVSLAVTLVFAPLTHLGMANLSLALWRGRAFRLKNLPDFFRGRRWAKSVGFCALWMALPFVVGSVANFLPGLDAIDGSAGSMTLLAVAIRITLRVLYVYLLLRLAPAPLLYVLEPDSRSPFATIRQGWLLTRGQLWGMVRFALRLGVRCLPGLVAYIVALFLISLLPIAGTLWGVLLQSLVFSAILIFLTPLLALGAVAYMDPWLPTDSQTRRAGRKGDE